MPKHTFTTENQLWAYEKRREMTDVIIWRFVCARWPPRLDDVDDYDPIKTQRLPPSVDAKKNTEKTHRKMGGKEKWKWHIDNRQFRSLISFASARFMFSCATFCMMRRRMVYVLSVCVFFKFSPLFCRRLVVGCWLVVDLSFRLCERKWWFFSRRKLTRRCGKALGWSSQELQRGMNTDRAFI